MVLCIGLLAPIGRISRASIARSNLACNVILASALFIEKQRARIRRLNQACFTVGRSASKCAPNITEQFALQKLLRNRGTVDSNKGFIPSSAQLMDWATTSLPVPLSPTTITLDGLGAIRLMSRFNCRITRHSPTNCSICGSSGAFATEKLVCDW